MAGCDMQKNVNETHNFYVENLLDVRRKNHGTVVHSKIHYINGMSTTTSSLFNSLNRTESLATKSYLQHKQQQQQESKTNIPNQSTQLKFNDTYIDQLNKYKLHGQLFNNLQTYFHRCLRRRRRRQPRSVKLPKQKK